MSNNVKRRQNMKCEHIADITGGQDGAIFGNYLFRFENNGEGRAYDVRDIVDGKGERVSEIASFRLDKAELICPHSNSVVFGTEFYAEGEEFPLLYSNIYNNYAKANEQLKGVCCVYRLFRVEGGFDTELVQLIEIGFVDDAELWRMSPEAEGKRPYGNFVIDRERNIYYAFVMREQAEGTRYFSFDLPKVSAGVPDVRYGVKRVVLGKEDVIEMFDCEHHNFVQGACCRNGRIYSLEGFNNKPGTDRPPALRIIDASAKKQVCFINLADHGFDKEPEVIDFFGDECICSDVYGKVYKLIF